MAAPPSFPALIVHGGAGSPPEEERPEREAAVNRALEAGWASIGDGALAAVIAAVRAMEDEPSLNAGYGACLNADGVVELDAAVMEGADLRVGAVAAVRDVRHPVDLARLVMEDGRHVLLVAEGASRFARGHGIGAVAPDDLVSPGRRRDHQRAPEADTVGAVARDAGGRLAVAVSTGGITGKLPGRVGDSPLAGAGFYADDQMGAACGTGQGEAFIRLCLCHLLTAELAHGYQPQAAADGAVELLSRRLGAEGGVIVLGLTGPPVAAFNTAFMPVAVRHE